MCAARGVTDAAFADYGTGLEVTGQTSSDEVPTKLAAWRNLVILKRLRPGRYWWSISVRSMRS
jgi:hypothetical protein